MQHRWCWLSILIGIASGMSSGSATVAAESSIEFVDRWTNVFGDSRVPLRIAVTSSAALNGRVAWSLSSNSRTIARGETAHEFKPGAAVEVALPLEFPAVKDGVIFAAQVEVNLLPERGENSLAHAARQFWICAADPFAERNRWLAGLEISLFDPEGKTAETFSANKIPFRQVRSVAALAAQEKGLLLIGEGISLGSQRGLAAELAKLASHGRKVLCLAPADGSLSWDDLQPLLEGDDSSIQLKRRAALAELDKRLDTESWLGSTPIVASGLRLSAARNRLALEVTDDPAGWPYVGFSHRSGGRLLFVGFGMIRGWNSSPAARIAFARLLEYLDGAHSSDSEIKPGGNDR